MDSRFRRYETVAAWVVGLNDFLRRGLADHAKRPHWDAARTSRGGEALLAAQNRCAVLGRSIIANCYSDGGNITSDAAAAQLVTESAAFASDPLACERICVDPKDAEVAAWLRSGGVRRLVVGHKPSGDCPAVLCSRYTGLEVISADLSFSDVKCADNRGAAVAGVLLQGETLHANHAVVFGTLQDEDDGVSSARCRTAARTRRGYARSAARARAPAATPSWVATWATAGGSRRLLMSLRPARATGCARARGERSSARMCRPTRCRSSKRLRRMGRRYGGSATAHGWASGAAATMQRVKPQPLQTCRVGGWRRERWRTARA